MTHDTPKPTTRQFQAYLVASRRPFPDGIGHNDTWNLATFGIDKATYDRIHRAVTDAYGPFGQPERLHVADLRRLWR